jgi:hypothetical protein
LPRYESSQSIITFIRRLNMPFSGFTSQMVPMDEGMTQMLMGQITYIENRIALAIFTRPLDKQDCVVLSRPLFHIPDAALLELFEQLLFWNNGATEMVHFAIDEPLNTINLVCFRTMEAMSFQEFQRCLENIVVVAKNSAKRLQPEFGLLRL